MKKFLLSLGVVALGVLGANATDYTVFDIENPGTWTAGSDGWSCAKDANGFSITTAKANSSNDLISPADNEYSWRVYKGSAFTVTSENVDMKTVTITYDTYEYKGKGYISTLTLTDGWEGTLKDNIFNAVKSAGSKTFTAQADNQQVRIKKIVVSDEVKENPGNPDMPDNPDTPDNPDKPVGKYVVFDINNPGTWTGDADGWSRAKDENGFTITTTRGTCTSDLPAPDANQYAWRVYKNSGFTITSENIDMKSIIITYDTYTVDGKGYVSTLTLADGWTGTLNENVYVVVNADGSKTFSATSDNQQVRITRIEISDEVVDVPTTPTTGDFVIFNIDQPGNWTGDGNGWTSGPDANGFTITTSKADCSSELANPVANNFSWRVYKGSSFTITSDVYDMKEMVITYDDYTTDDGKGYISELTLSEGWTGSLDGTEYTLTSAGQKSLTANANQQQVRIKKIVVKNSGAVKGVELDSDAPATYYNLQGVRVNNPEKGIYIVVKGGKSHKVMF